MRFVNVKITASVTGVITVDDSVRDDQITDACVDIIFAPNTKEFCMDKTDLGCDKYEVLILDEPTYLASIPPTIVPDVMPDIKRDSIHLDEPNTLVLEHYNAIQSIIIPIEPTDTIKSKTLNLNVGDSLVILNFDEVYIKSIVKPVYVKAKISAEFVYVNTTIFKLIV